MHSIKFIGLMLSVLTWTCCTQDSGKGDEVLTHVTEEHPLTMQQSPQTIAALIRKDGWKVPSIDGSKITRPRQKYHFVDEPSTEVFVTEYEPRERISTEHFDLNDEERRFLHLASDQEYSILRISQFDVDGRVFCYSTLLNKVSKVTTNNVTSNSSGLVSVNFYDKNGDSKFETLQWGGYRSSKLSIPDWAIQTDNGSACLIPSPRS